MKAEASRSHRCPQTLPVPGVPKMTARLALLGILLVCASCADLRGRRRVREGNRLFREGLYAQALEHYRAAETLVPEFPLLWLNEGLTCRQLMIPGARTPENDRAADCAIQAFERLHGLGDPRGEQLQVQTLLDADRFAILERMYGERLRANPADLAAMNGLIHVQSRAGKMDEALRLYERRAALQPSDAEAQYAVGVFAWQELFRRGGGPEQAAFDPRPDPAAPQAVRKGSRKGAKKSEPQKKQPPPTRLGDIVGQKRAALADLGIKYLERAVALQPKYREAMAYLALLHRQKAIAFFAEPDKWQAMIDAAERWSRAAAQLGSGAASAANTNKRQEEPAPR
jgi:tetratricopeptide (TPR) repeat protein